MSNKYLPDFKLPKENMLTFLKSARQFLSIPEHLCIVIGNESCDLDSAVCAISLAYFYHDKPNRLNASRAFYFVPVLNIPRNDFSLKTEVKYLFAKYAISSDHLLFRDDLTDNIISKCDFILVDHHVSEFARRCVQVIDHRPMDPHAEFAPGCEIIIQPVGSCATLIAEIVLSGIRRITDIGKYQFILQMMRSTIILDTVNFSREANRATYKDTQVCDALKEVFERSIEFREQQSNQELFHPQSKKEMFLELCRARADVSSLTAEQILRKDRKIISNINNNVKISLPGFPLLVSEFVNKPGSIEAVTQHAANSNCSIIILLGMLVNLDTNSVQRDIGIINFGDIELANAIMMKLLASDELVLEEINSINFLDGRFFKQNNVQATRKHILPIINEVLSNWAVSTDVDME